MNSEIDCPAEYDNSARVANSSPLINKYITDAANFREIVEVRSQLNLSYGDAERNMMDMFWPNNTAGQEHKSPIVMFIHGGYWQRLDHSCFSHLAAGLNAHGVAVAMPCYTLCPDIQIEGIINEIRRACLVLFQTYRRRITVIGHSAGGHLAACMMATDWPKIHSLLPSDLIAAGVGISGIYDLLPICRTPVNEAMNMSDQQAIAASPVNWTPEGLQQFDAWVGSEDSNEYHRQSRELADRWSLLGTPTEYVSVPDANHFTIVDALVDPDSGMVRRILGLVQKPQAHVELPALDDDEMDSLVQRFVEESQSDTNPDPDGEDDEIPESDLETASLGAALVLPPEAMHEPGDTALTEHEPEQAAQCNKKDTAAQK